MNATVPELVNVRPVSRPSTWVWPAVVLILVAMIVHGLLPNPNYRWDIVGQYLLDARVVAGVGWTLLLTLGSMIIGIVLAVLMAIVRQGKPSAAACQRSTSGSFAAHPSTPSSCSGACSRSCTPRLSLGMPFGPESITLETSVVFNAAIVALLGLGLNECAYLAGIVQGGLNSVDKEQSEAATALGRQRTTTLWRIIIPRPCGSSFSRRGMRPSPC